MKNELPIMPIRAKYADELNGEKGTEGQVLTADGNGGSSWQDPQGGLDPTEIPSGDIEQDAILGLNSDDEVVKGNLYGKFVRIMDAPTSNYLTPEQREAVEQGVFINGDFRGFHNPIILPLNAGNRGLIIGTRGDNEDGEITTYKLWPHESSNPDLFEIPDVSLIEFSYINGFYLTIRGGRLVLNGVYQLNSKLFPSYPPSESQTNKKFHFVLDNGTLTWQEGMGLYKHTIVFNDDYEIQLISNNATAVDSLSALATFLKDPKTTQMLYVDHTNDECVFAPYGYSQNNASYDDQANEINLDFHYPAYDDQSGTSYSIQYRGLVISAPDGVTITDTVTAL